ncbi:MAG: DUF4432 family protein [Acidobacteria bacterium]|nr:DUF4432 family protein [Acidobacteriota bacterium]
MTNEHWRRSKEELAGYVGSLEQLLPVRRFTFTEGKAKGVEAIEAGTGTGLSLLFLVDRGLDLFEMRWCGRSLNWRSAADIVAPVYYERKGSGWLRGFGGGMLATCGLRNVGAGLEEGWETFGLHGEISYTPAAVQSRWVDSRLQLEISGEIREAYPFGPNLVIRRTWRTELGANWVELEDHVTNEGWRPEIHMQMYHCNVGYPLLSEHTRLYVTADTVKARDEIAARGLERWNRFQAPETNVEEEVFFHLYGGGKPSETSAVVVADERRRDFGLRLGWPTEDLPYLVEWKLCAKGNYVLGVEPANCLVGGRNWHREAGIAPLDAGASVRFRLRFDVLTTGEAVAEALRPMTA